MTMTTIIISIVTIVLVTLFFWDMLQKKHSILRTYPLVGHLRYFLEWLGIYLRQYWFSPDRSELPFNRATRTWIYQAAKAKNTMVGFGSTRDLHPVGTVFFVNAPFPTFEKMLPEPITIGPNCKTPYKANSLFNISAMSYGSISKNAVLALSYGAKKSGCWLNTGEGGVSSYHLESGCDLIAQIGTAKYGFCDQKGNLSDEALRGVALYPQIKMFELKLSQGAKPGKGGILPAVKVTPEIAAIRMIQPHQDSISPNRFPEIGNVSELLDVLSHIRKLTGKPTGFKTVLGTVDMIEDLCKEILKRGPDSAPDFITLDGAEGGTGASPAGLVDYMGLPIAESLPLLVDTLVTYGLRDRIKIIAAGKLVTPAEVVWALCMGADFVSSCRGFMFALGCIQALKCHTNHCPTGITTHNPYLTRALDPTDKAVRVTNYVNSIIKETIDISHSCGLSNPHNFQRMHARIVTETGISKSMAELYPDKTPPVT